MRPLYLFALAMPLLGLHAVTPPRARAQGVAEQWRLTGVVRCPRADTLFGRYWRSHAPAIRVRYSAVRDTTSLATRGRTSSWQIGSSRLAGTDAVIELPGREPKSDSARIELTLRFVDSIYRTSEQARLDLKIDDTVHLVIVAPRVDYATGVKVEGVPLIVSMLLTPEQSLMLARGHVVKGTMGPFPFFLFDWEMWDINAIYRASFCGSD